MASVVPSDGGGSSPVFPALPTELSGLGFLSREDVFNKAKDVFDRRHFKTEIAPNTSFEKLCRLFIVSEHLEDEHFCELLLEKIQNSLNIAPTQENLCLVIKNFADLCRRQPYSAVFNLVNNGLNTCIRRSIETLNFQDLMRQLATVTSISGSTPRKLSEFLMGLPLSLDLSSLPMTIEMFKSVLEAFPEMEALNLSHTMLTGTRLNLLLELKALRRLDLSGCVEISSNLFNRFLIGKKDLTHLNLSGCTQLTDATLTPLRGFESLEYLNLSGCTQLTGAVLTPLERSMALRRLDLAGCSYITDTEIESLLQLPSHASLEVVRP